MGFLVTYGMIFLGLLTFMLDFFRGDSNKIISHRKRDLIVVEQLDLGPPPRKPGHRTVVVVVPPYGCPEHIAEIVYSFQIYVNNPRFLVTTGLSKGSVATLQYNV